MTETEAAFPGLLTPDATPAAVKPWADQFRQRAAYHRGEADHLDAMADALYRWCAQNEAKP